MVCVNQFTGEKSQEPFSTLAKTRKVNGKVVFGRHVSLSSMSEEDEVGDAAVQGSSARRRALVKVGDVVVPFYEIC